MKHLIIFSISVLIFISCKKDNESAITSAYYFTADIAGQKVVFEDGKNGYGCGAGSSGGSVYDGFQEVQSLNVSRFINIRESAGVLILKTFSASPSGCNQIQDMFKIGNYSYGSSAHSSEEYGINGVVVYYVDNNGVEWASDKGAATQTNSSFEIVEHINNTDGYSAKITKAKFKCTLYDGNGNSRLLTNGEIRSRSVTCGF